MRLAQLFEDGTSTLRLIRDNPGGAWLDEKRKDSKEAGENRWGAPARFGTVTGAWSRKVLVPTDVVARLKGVQGEHYRVRQDDLDGLHDYMGKNKRFPPFRDENPEHQYFPFITVYQDGTPWISEGNHRIMSAKKLGWKFIPIELRYFNGAELEDGPLSPSKVKAYDEAALAQGYEPNDKYHPGD